MLSIRVLSCCLLTSALALSQDPATPPTKSACLRALQQYAATAQAEPVIHADAAYLDTSETVLSTARGRQALVEASASRARELTAEIELLGEMDGIAAAKLTWPGRIEYIHLARTGDAWKVLQVTAQPPIDKETDNGSPDDYLAVRSAVWDYVDAFYLGEPERLDRSVHRQLVKYEVRGDGLRPMSHQALRELAAGADPARFPSFARRHVEILDVGDRTAAARLEGAWGVDFLQLIKTDGVWMTRHVVWQRYPAEPLRIADAINDNCPVSGKPISADALTRQAGQVVGFCCGDCPKRFAAEGAAGISRLEKQLEAESWDAPIPVREPADTTRMVQLPDGTYLPALNGATGAPPIQFRGRPFSPVTAKTTDTSGREWYLHGDGSYSTTIMQRRHDLNRYDATTQVAHPKAGVEYRGIEGPGRGLHIVLISGDEEYRSEEALPQLGKILAKHHGFRCTVLFPIDPEDGTINPDVNDNIPGLDALATADLMVIATRFRNLPDDQMAHIDAYLQSGKPVVGMRTATHAFKIPKDKKYARYDFRSQTWKGGFGRQVLGETWINHHGRHGRQSTRGVPAEGRADHPILRGIEAKSIWGPTDVYGVRLPLPDGCDPIVMGQVLAGMEQHDDPVDGEKNDPMMPIAWTKTYEIEDGAKGRVFTTTMGAATDLVAEGTRRMLVNACYWALGLERQIPERSNVDLVGKFEPTPFGFGKFEKGVKPAAHKMDAAK